MVDKTMKNTISKLCACLCFVGALAFAPACGPSGTKDGGSSCAEGQKKAEVNGEEGCYDECQDGMCGAGETCKSGLCISAGSDNGDTNNGTPNNGTPNNGTPNSGTPNNGTPNNGTPNNNGTNNNATNTNGTNNTNNVTPIDPALQMKCEQAADLLYGMCFVDHCTLDAEQQSAIDSFYDTFLNGNGTAENPSCARYATDNPEFETTLDEFLANNDCDTLSSQRCGDFALVEECSCTTPTNLGTACTDDTPCGAGDLDGVCLTEADNGFTGGYCAAFSCPGLPDVSAGFDYPSAACGDDGVCRVLVDQPGTPQESRFGVCLAGCDGCNRDGYACQLTNIVRNADMELEAVQVCLEACTSNADCSDDGSVRCNTDSGSCEIECDGTPGPNGEPSLAEICAEVGGTCTNDEAAGKEYCVL